MLDAPCEESFIEKSREYQNESRPDSTEPSCFGCEETRLNSDDTASESQILEADTASNTSSSRTSGADESEVKDKISNDDTTESKSHEDRLNSDSSTEFSGSMLSLTNSESGKRKQNFMNKCVSKVKNLIRK